MSDADISASLVYDVSGALDAIDEVAQRTNLLVNESRTGFETVEESISGAFEGAATGSQTAVSAWADLAREIDRVQSTAQGLGDALKIELTDEGFDPRQVTEIIERAADSGLLKSAAVGINDLIDLDAGAEGVGAAMVDLTAQLQTQLEENPISLDDVIEVPDEIIPQGAIDGLDQAAQSTFTLDNQLATAVTGMGSLASASSSLFASEGFDVQRILQVGGAYERTAAYVNRLGESYKFLAGAGSIAAVAIIGLNALEANRNRIQEAVDASFFDPALIEKAVIGDDPDAVAGEVTRIFGDVRAQLADEAEFAADDIGLSFEFLSEAIGGGMRAAGTLGLEPILEDVLGVVDEIPGEGIFDAIFGDRDEAQERLDLINSLEGPLNRAGVSAKEVGEAFTNLDFSGITTELAQAGVSSAEIDEILNDLIFTVSGVDDGFKGLFEETVFSGEIEDNVAGIALAMSELTEEGVDYAQVLRDVDTVQKAVGENPEILEDFVPPNLLDRLREAARIMGDPSTYGTSARADALADFIDIQNALGGPEGMAAILGDVAVAAGTSEEALYGVTEVTKEWREAVVDLQGVFDEFATDRPVDSILADQFDAARDFREEIESLIEGVKEGDISGSLDDLFSLDFKTEAGGDAFSAFESVFESIKSGAEDLEGTLGLDAAVSNLAFMEKALIDVGVELGFTEEAMTAFVEESGRFPSSFGPDIEKAVSVARDLGGELQEITGTIEGQDLTAVVEVEDQATGEIEEIKVNITALGEDPIQVPIDADTGEAVLSLETFIAATQDTTGEVTLDAADITAYEKVAAWIAYASASEGESILSADPAEAERQVQIWVDWAMGRRPTPKVDADTELADNAVGDWKTRADGTRATVYLDANAVAAQKELDDLAERYRQQAVSIPVDYYVRTGPRTLGFQAEGGVIRAADGPQLNYFEGWHDEVILSRGTGPDRWVDMLSEAGFLSDLLAQAPSVDTTPVAREISRLRVPPASVTNMSGVEKRLDRLVRASKRKDRRTRLV